MNFELKQNKKLELIQWVSTLEEDSVIEKLMMLRKEDNKDWWYSISEVEKSGIEKGLYEANLGKLNPQLSARNIYEKWL